MPKRVAAIDVSHWHSANDAAYLRILRDLGRDIVGVSDPDLRIAKERAERFGTTPFTDYRQMIEATRPEFVQRCLRVQLTKTALSEKPQIRPQDRVVFRRRKVFHRRSSVLVSHARLDTLNDLLVRLGERCRITRVVCPRLDVLQHREDDLRSL